MNPWIRNAFGVVAGIGIGGALVMVVELVNATLFPPPPGADLSDPETVARIITEGGSLPLVGVAVAWFAGTFVGTFMATRVAETRGRGPGGVVAAFFFAGALWTLFSFPHPAWFWVVGLVAIAAAGHLGYTVGASPPGAVGDGGGKNAPFE